MSLDFLKKGDNMSVIMFFVIASTVGQLLTCGFSLWWIVSLICRMIFILRSFGIIFKTKPLFVGEGFSLGMMLLWYFLFRKESIPWLTILLTVLFTGLVVFLEWLDGILYVYEVIDEEDF